MRKYISAAFLALSALLAPVVSHAAVIDFEEVTDFEVSKYGGYYYNALVNDYGVAWREGRYNQMGSWNVGTTGPSSWYPGTPGNYAHSGDNYVFGPLISSLNLIGNGVALTSMWARVANTVNETASISIIAIKNGQLTASKSFELTDTYKLLSVDFVDADEIIISGGSYGALLIDDMVMSNAAAVPEPETYAMLMAGLGLIGFAARRKRTAA